MTRAEWRLMPALGASALLHAWLMQAAPGVHVLRMPVERAHMSVVLGVPVDWLAAENEAQPLVDAPAAPAMNRFSAAEVRPAAATEPVNAAAVTEQRSLPQPSDPTYYAATSLDVYPKAQVALDLSMRLPGAPQGEIRATVLIDEAGVVKEVRDLRGIEPHAEAENTARDVLFSTRFTPARKDGRIVKAQVVVSLKYGGAAP